jgi:hypothetical protein
MHFQTTFQDLDVADDEIWRSTETERGTKAPLNFNYRLLPLMGKKKSLTSLNRAPGPDKAGDGRQWDCDDDKLPRSCRSGSRITEKMPRTS